MGERLLHQREGADQVGNVLVECPPPKGNDIGGPDTVTPA